MPFSRHKQGLKIFSRQFPPGMASVKSGGHFQDIYKAFCDMVGYTEEELLKMTVLDITREDDISASDGPDQGPAVCLRH